MALARHGGDDYVFSLLTGYFDAPAGVKVDEGKSYNPYFPGGVISMPQQLYDEGIEYKDGTSATQSQQAKDVTTFMHWTAEPYHDKRKMYGLKVCGGVLPGIIKFLFSSYCFSRFFVPSSFMASAVHGPT